MPKFAAKKPNGAARGRPPVSEEERLLVHNTRFNKGQIAKLSQLGGHDDPSGNKWLRDRVDKAKIPA